MNEFGRQAMTAWQEMVPTALSRLENPTAYFQDLGERAHEEWVSLTAQLLEPDQPGEDYFHKVGRIQEAKMTARETIVAQWCLPPTEEIEQEPLPLP